MITYQEISSAVRSPSKWKALAERYGKDEVLNSANLYDEIGPEKYQAQFSQTHLPATARESTVPYDQEAGFFSTKNLGALAENFGPNAYQTYEGLKAVYDDPTLLGQMFTREGAAAIADDFAEFAEDPAKRIVEQPFTSMLDLAPGVKGAGAIAKRAVPNNLARNLKSLDEYLHEATPNIARILDEGGNLATDPLKTTLRAGKGVTKGGYEALQRIFALGGEAFSGVDQNSIRKAIDSTKLSPKQKTAAKASPAYTPSGAAMRLFPGRLGTPTVETTPLKYFKEVVTGVRDESLILRDVLTAAGEITNEIADTFHHTLPDLFENMTEKFDLLPAIDKWKDSLTKELTGVKVSLQQQETVKAIKNPLSMGQGYIAAEAAREVPVMVPKMSIDISKSSLLGIADDRLDTAVKFLNEHFKDANNLDPKAAYILMRNIDNLILDVPMKGADAVQGLLADLRHHIREQFTTMTEKLPGGKTINDQLQEVDDQITYLADLQKEFGLYTKSKNNSWEVGETPKNVNAGALLKKIMAGGRKSEKFRQRLLERLEARVGPLTTGLAAMQMKEALPANIVGKAVVQAAFHGVAQMSGSHGMGAASLLGTLSLASPRLMSRWARWLGYPKRVGDWVEEIGENINQNKVAKMMQDAGYTVGGILLNHGKIREAADKKHSEDRRVASRTQSSKRMKMTDF